MYRIKIALLFWGSISIVFLSFFLVAFLLADNGWVSNCEKRTGIKCSWSFSPDFKYATELQKINFILNAQD